jgi:hypothetical protein
MVSEYKARFGFSLVCSSTNLLKNVRSRSLSLVVLLEFSFYFEYQDYLIEKSVLDCGEPHY